MISVTDKEKCTGCEACANACPVDAIIMEEDCEGFRYPVVKTEECINCGKCEKVCSMYNTYTPKGITEICYAAILKNRDKLERVSSGGVFLALAKNVIDENGVVYGVRQSNEPETVYHDRAETMEDACSFCRSKYLQSHNKECYRKIKNDLEKGRKVFYSGTGCQIAGLYLYLKKEYDNLFTGEVICHGVPSIKAFRLYLSETEAKNRSKIKEIVYRDKRYGWKNNHYAIYFENGKVVRQPSAENPFHKGYINGLYYRPSCMICKYARLPRVADLTMADFWKYRGELQKDNDMGISLIVTNTQKGESLLKAASGELDIEKVSMEEAVNSCRHLTNIPESDPKRDEFFKKINESGFYRTLYSILGKPGIRDTIRIKYREIRYLLKK